MKNKLKGYTILEVLMAMIISSIVMLSAWSGMERISNMYRAFRMKNEVINEVTLLNRVLMGDFSKSSYVSLVDNSLNCIYPDKKVEYIFSENFILRKTSVMDTFFIPTSNMAIGFIKNAEGEATEFVNELSCDRIDKNEKYALHYFKNYAAEALINIKKASNGN